MPSLKEFPCSHCDKSYQYKAGLLGHVNKKHTDNEIPQRTSKTRATKPAVVAQNVTMASKPADIEDKLKCKVCLTKCSDEEVLKNT